MRQSDEAAGIGKLGLTHAVVDGAVDRKLGLIEAGAAGEYAGVDAGCVHDPNVRAKIRKQRIEQIRRITVAIELDRSFARVSLEQLRRRVMLLEVDEHSVPGCAPHLT